MFKCNKTLMKVKNAEDQYHIFDSETSKFLLPTISGRRYPIFSEYGLHFNSEQLLFFNNNQHFINKYIFDNKGNILLKLNNCNPFLSFNIFGNTGIVNDFGEVEFIDKDLNIKKIPDKTYKRISRLSPTMSPFSGLLDSSSNMYFCEHDETDKVFDIYSNNGLLIKSNIKSKDIKFINNIDDACTFINQYGWQAIEFFDDSLINWNQNYKAIFSSIESYILKLKNLSDHDNNPIYVWPQIHAILLYITHKMISNGIDDAVNLSHNYWTDFLFKHFDYTQFDDGEFTRTINLINKNEWSFKEVLFLCGTMYKVDKSIYHI